LPRLWSAAKGFAVFGTKLSQASAARITFAASSRKNRYDGTKQNFVPIL
jgi:hypothetical protein